MAFVSGGAHHVRWRRNAASSMRRREIDCSTCALRARAAPGIALEAKDHDRSGGELNDAVSQLQRSNDAVQVLGVVKQYRRILRAQHVAPHLERVSRWLMQSQLGPESECDRDDTLDEQIWETMVWPTLVQAMEWQSKAGTPAAPAEKIAMHVINTLHAAALLFPGKVLPRPRTGKRVAAHRLLTGRLSQLERVCSYLDAQRSEWHEDTVLISRLWWACVCLGVQRMPHGVEAHMKSLPFELHPCLLGSDKKKMELSVQQLVKEIELKHDTINVNGKQVKELRQTAWMSTTRSFEYSGKTMPPLPFSPTVERVRETLKRELGLDFDGCLINYYEDGKVAMSYHQDPDMGTIWEHDTCVVSVGATRVFCARRVPSVALGVPETTETSTEPDRYEFCVRDTDVLHMKHDCQRLFEHCIKKMKGKSFAGPRISLVFKKAIIPAPQDQT
ncbi:Uncharacterized protein FVE85_8056 [Porphyridium purpureum]|uniref:Fe2OG dioxygenase domain-containing protein n=1 Tax=Porphyridium purpureum TaxID=35688 RepID=A0A5J4YM98_PORPP|nr:Uncharacterized protein FVE85_8056 [Porphyridium purpureum]|eukprot:POR5911..scf295_9